MTGDKRAVLNWCHLGRVKRFQATLTKQDLDTFEGSFQNF